MTESRPVRELQLAGGRRLVLDRPLIMGILNVTPDSFSDGGKFVDPEVALRHARAMTEAGATLIDVGGESTRPGAAQVNVADELARVLPVIEALAADRLLVSVDTSKPEVMQAAAAAGAVMINDVRALQEPGALAAVAATDLAVCLMHMQGAPRTMQDNPRYRDVVTDVAEFLQARVEVCEQAGIARERMLVDPGFGFGKTLQHNLALLQGLPHLDELGTPLLVGLSRKSMLEAITGRPVAERLAGSLALAMLSAQAGAHIIRVHDVAETRDVLAVLAASNSAD